ncbi:MAG: hypothetical protein K9M03_03680 [Kiritimatiellales bacterium]|nr:hypothetical protein [Kiritimatiellales bacterium]
MKVSFSKIIIFGILVFVIGGFTSWFFVKNSDCIVSDQSVPNTISEPDEADSKKTSNNDEWIEYYDGLYGFEFKYPEWVIDFKHNNDQSFENIPKDITNLSFVVFYQGDPFQSLPIDLNKPDPVCMANFVVSVKEKFFVDAYHGVINTDSYAVGLEEVKSLFKNSEYVTVLGRQTDDVTGVRKNESAPLPPGGPQDMIWLPRDSYVYTLSYTINYEDTNYEEATKQCVIEQQKLFDQFVSSFRFTRI